MTRPKSSPTRSGSRALARWQRVYAKMRAELGAVRAALPSMAPEVGDAEAELARVDAALRSATPSRKGAGRFDPLDLELRGASLRDGGHMLRVRFARGPERELDLGALDLPSHPISAEVDDLRHGVVLRLASGEVVDVSSGRVLYESDPAYRAMHAPATGESPDVGARIRAIRLASGRTAREVAAAAGLAASNYARLEASRHVPRVDTLLRVARALDVTLGELVVSAPRRTRRSR